MSEERVKEASPEKIGQLATGLLKVVKSIKNAG